MTGAVSSGERRGIGPHRSTALASRPIKPRTNAPTRHETNYLAAFGAMMLLVLGPAAVLLLVAGLGAVLIIFGFLEHVRIAGCLQADTPTLSLAVVLAMMLAVHLFMVLAVVLSHLFGLL
jgi:hypothetical protein